MWKFIIAGAIAVALTGTSLRAQQTAPATNAALQPAPSASAQEDAAAFFDARIAALKAGLKLTADQDKNWPPVEAALREMQAQQIKRNSELRSAAADPAGDALLLLRHRAEVLAMTATDLKHLADAAEPLYKTLDDGQKRRLRLLIGGARARR